VTQSGPSLIFQQVQVQLTDWRNGPFVLRLVDNNDKAKPA
jgi:hypothetical protein